MTAIAPPALQGVSLRDGARSLSLTPEGILSFVAADGAEWKSAGPLCIVHYYDRQHPRAQEAAVPTRNVQAFGTAGTPSLSAKTLLTVEAAGDREIRAMALCANVGLSVTLRFLLPAGGDGFDVRIEDAGVQEDNPRLYRLLSVELLPDYGAARTGEEGYLTLPNWSGCQTFYDKAYPREVRQTVYSSNDQWEHVCNMPVFGITRRQGTLCGLIVAGDMDAQLVCRVHWEDSRANGVHPALVYRWQQQDEREPGPREVRYRFEGPQGASGEGYAFCGKVYRDFLRKERGLRTWKEKGESRPEALEYRDRFFLKIFMAYKTPQADGKGPYHATCTFAETREILEDCLRRGVRKVTAILVGWGIDGHDGMPPTRFPVDERLGGEAGMRDLAAWCRENDVVLGVHDSYGGVYGCSPEFDIGDLICHRTGEYWESVIWSGGQVHNACPRVFLEKHARRDIPDIAKLGLHGHHHIDAVGSFVTCHAPEHPLERRSEFVAEVRKMFELATEVMGSVSTEMPFGPYFDVVDGFFHSYSRPSPWHLASAVGRHFHDRTVPLLEVALHGSVSLGEFMADLVDDPLHWLDWGLVPQYEVCRRPSPDFGVSAYEGKAAMIQAAYALYYGEGALTPRFANLLIEKRREPVPGVSVTRYSDGTTVRVNRSGAAWDGIPAGSYRIE